MKGRCEMIPYEVDMMINKNIKAQRLRLNMTQKTLSEKLGKSVRMIQKYEEGEVEPRISTLNKIATIFEISVKDLIFTRLDVILPPRTLTDLLDAMEVAISDQAPYFAVEIKTKGYSETELIINKTENFRAKADYYKNAYNKDLTLKTFDGIKIVSWLEADNLDDIQCDLVY
ncbi:MAG: helix-turn-helix domain-containing protein [Clostridium sp.]